MEISSSGGMPAGCTGGYRFRSLRFSQWLESRLYDVIGIQTTALMYFFRGHKIIEMNTSLMAMFPPRVV